MQDGKYLKLKSSTYKTVKAEQILLTHLQICTCNIFLFKKSIVSNKQKIPTNKDVTISAYHLKKTKYRNDLNFLTANVRCNILVECLSFKDVRISSLMLMFLWFR